MEVLPDWYYNEFRQVGVDYADDAEVLAYDQSMRKIRNLHEEIESIITAVNLNRNDTVLEIGTGTGELALGLAGYCRKVYAADVSPVMLEIARRKAEVHRRDNIEFVRAGFLTYEHRGPLPEVVISQLALHHLPDFWRYLALKRIYQLLPPGGRLYLRDVVFPSVDDYAGFFDGLLAEIEASAGERIAGETKIHVREEYSTLDWIMEGLLQKAGFTLIKADYFSGFLAVYVCAK